MAIRSRAKQLLIANPTMNYKEFKKLTGLSRTTYLIYKKELLNIALLEAEELKHIEEIKIRIERKRNLIKDMTQRMKKRGYLNLNGTPLENLR